MTKSERLRIWLAVTALTLAAALATGVRAQDGGPATDTFANTSSITAVYNDQTSSSCDEKNHGSLAMDSPDPAICLDLPTRNGQCTTLAGENSTFEGQTGNMCHFCQEGGYQELRSLYPNWIVVPNDGSGAATAAYQQGFQCSANPGDPCYLTCYGRGSFKPPPGTTLRAGTGTGGTPTPSGGNQPPIKLQGRVSNDPDACYPAGPKNYDACDYPNVTRPAGCTCSETPAPQAATPLPAQAASSPCLPYGPGGYDYCQNPIGTRLPAGCSCSRSTPKPQPKTAPTTSQPPNEGTYLQGIVDGIGTCLQSLQANYLGLTAGAGYFAMGDFVHAAELWGVQPGQSVTLNNLTAPFKSLYKDMTTPQVGVVSNVSDYQRGVAGGKNLCKYWLIPAAKQAIKAALNGGPQTTGGTPSNGSVPQIPGPSGKPAQLPGGNGGKPPQLPGGSGSSGTSPPPQFSGGGSLLPVVGNHPPAVSPNAGQVPSASSDPGADAPTVPPSGAPADAVAVAGGGDGVSSGTPLWGGALQLDLDRDPESLAGKYVKLPDGRVIQLGGFLGKGGFADVYKYGDLAIKLSKKESTYEYGPDSLAGQDQGAERLQGTGVQIPKVYEYQAGGNGVPASLVTGNADTEFPGFKEITPKEFQAMPAAGQAAVLKAMTDLTNPIAAKGYVLGDPNPANIRFKPVGDGYQAMLLDTDMVMTVPEIQAAAKSPGASPAAFVHGGVVNWGLELANQSKFDLNTATPQSLTDVLNEGRANRLSGATNAPEAAAIK